MNIVDFCDANDINWTPIKVKVSKGSKGKYEKQMEPLLGVMPNVKDFYDDKWIAEDMPKLQTYYRGLSEVERDKLTISMDTQNIYHLDVDWLETKEYTTTSEFLVDKFLKKCPYYKSTTKALGKHLFFRLDKKLTKKKQLIKETVNCDLYEDLEILSGCMGWCPSSGTVIQSELPIPTFTKSELPLKHGAPCVGDVKEKVKYTVKKKDKKPIEECLDLDKTSKTFRYADIIALKYLDEYESWLKIMWSLKSEGEKAVAHYISQKSDKFRESEFNRRWDGIEPTSITLGTLYYFAKISDKKAYRSLQHEDMESTEFIDSDDTQARIFLRNYEDNLVYKNNQIYLYIGNDEGTEGRWFCDEKNEMVKKFISDYLSGLQISYIEKLTKQDEELTAQICELEECEVALKCELEEEQKKVSKQIEYAAKLCSKLKNCAKINSIAERLRSLLAVRDFQEIEFDRNPYLLPFNNTCYDLKTHNWVGTRRENYILQTTGYNWKTPDEKQVKKIDKLIKEIFPDKKIRQEYTHYLATALYGIPIEKFIFASGGGGNGKGVINELMLEVCGNFGYAANNAVLLNPLKDGGNPAIANMGSKRFINYREPEEKKSLNLSAIKELTGGKGICARKLYSNEDKVELVGTHILELNKKCAMNGDLGDSILRRLRDIPFVSTYTTDTELLKKRHELTNVFKANPYYKTIDFQDEFKYALFIYLIRYCKRWEHENPSFNVCSRLYVADAITVRTKKYIEDNDHIFMILKQNYVKDVCDSSYVKFQEFWMYFKNSDFYRTLSKHEQNKTYSEKQVIEHLKTSTSTRIFFKETMSFKKSNGDVITYRNVLKYWRLKTSDETMKEQLEEGKVDFEEDDYIAE